MRMDNSTESGDQLHSMGDLLGDHQMALASVSVLSLILGLPLTLHMLWHLQVWIALVQTSPLTVTPVTVIQYTDIWLQ